MSTALLHQVLEFLEDEADNRAAAGSEMSDYEREPSKLAEELRDWLASIGEALLTD
jgi:hypothetical protein